jgi:hypothetical protein
MLGIIYDENRTRESVESDIAIRVGGWRATPRHSSATYMCAGMSVREEREASTFLDILLPFSPMAIHNCAPFSTGARPSRSPSVASSFIQNAKSMSVIFGGARIRTCGSFTRKSHRASLLSFGFTSTLPRDVRQARQRLRCDSDGRLSV